MTIRRSTTKAAALAMGVSLPLLGLSSAASAAKATKSAVGSAPWCAHHAKLAKKTAACATAGGGTGGGAGSPAITIQIDPDPVVETGASQVVAVIQVETSPAFAGDTVDISSSQFDAACSGQEGYTEPPFSITSGSAQVLDVRRVLDDDGNASVAIFGQDCAPGPDVFEASLEVAPYLTALTTLVARPPVVTPTGLFGSPTTSGTVTTGEVETGDTTASGDSDVYAVFNVETSPVYAEQQVEFSSPQLDSRCLVSSSWIALSDYGFDVVGQTGGAVEGPAVTTIDDDGNATVIFLGRSCGAGPSDVIADVLAGTHPTYTTVFTIDPPAVTI